jgi:membrane protease YdiL (CAAX protease family)
MDRMDDSQRLSRPNQQRPMGNAALREALVLWALAFGVILVVRAIGPIAGYAKAAAAVAFLYLPGAVVWRRNEDYRDYGAHLSSWRRDVLWGLGASALILPLFALVFVVFVGVLEHIPAWLSTVLTPYVPKVEPALRFPARFWEHILDQFLVVALPEEFFYRGYLQTRLRDVWPGGKRRLFGVRLGPAFWLTAALFALGHLAIFQVWRLSVFFPALVFGWLREKTDSILPAVIFHALSNLTLFVLEASFFGAYQG